MERKTFHVRYEFGLPARKAAAFVHLVKMSVSEVWVEKDGQRRNGRSIVEFLSLGTSHGSVFTVSVEGEDEQAVIQQITNLLESGL